MQTRVIENALYYQYSALKNWYKNEETRLETQANWQKSIASIQAEGILTPFVIDEEGTVYDGNGRLLVLHHLFQQGITTAKNGTPLEWIPVFVVKTPKTEQEKWKLALIANTRFRSWNKETLANYQDEWEGLDVSLINIDFGDPISIDDQLAFADEDEPASKDTSPQKEPQEIECPSCGETFTLDSATKSKVS